MQTLSVAVERLWLILCSQMHDKPYMIVIVQGTDDNGDKRPLIVAGRESSALPFNSCSVLRSVSVTPSVLCGLVRGTLQLVHL